MKYFCGAKGLAVPVLLLFRFSAACAATLADDS